MILEHSVNLVDLESAYKTLNENAMEGLSLPTSLIEGGVFGIEPAIVQFLATWRNTSPTAELKLPVSGDEVWAHLKKLSEQPYLVAALYFAKSITDSQGNKIPKREALSPARNWVLRMYGEQPSLGSADEADFLCIHSAEHEFLPALYSRDANGNEVVKARTSFIDLLQRTLFSMDIPWESRKGESGYGESLGSLVYELIANTDEHARTDAKGQPIRQGVRGLMLRKRSIPKKDVMERFSGSNPSLLAYLHSRLTSIPSENENAEFLEISIIDSGVGLAKKWFSKEVADPQKWDEVSLPDEVRLVSECFKKHMTTKDSESAGIGLDAVLGHLKKLNAFLRIRTGRVCLFQNFSTGKEEGFAPKHWNAKEPELAAVSGSVFTVVMPLGGTR